MSRVTVLGMGAMGSRMAANLVEAGHTVTVWNRTHAKTTPLVEKGASAARTPAAAVEEAEFVVCMVRDDDASRRVWLDAATGALAAMPRNAVAIESSTVTVAWARELGERCREQGIAFADAPVLGTRPQAEAAELIYFVGSDAALLQRIEPVLRVMGATVHHAGPVGSGAAIKLAVNALLGLQVAAVGELIGFIQHLGLDKARAVEIVCSTPVCSPSAKGAAQGMVAGSFDPMFPIELVEKDLTYMVETAEANDAPVPLAEAAWQVFHEAVAEGYADLNISGVARLYE
jgi:3-hydroxyisobutyrate dehydrogenase